MASAFVAAFPHEACGFLLGVIRRGRAVAQEVAPASSSGAGRDHFDIPDFEVRRTLVRAAEQGLEIVALFHSHPSGDPRLSGADRAILRHSAWSWIILTRSGPGRRVFWTAYAAGDRPSREGLAARNAPA